MNDPSKNIYTYTTREWLELPIDSSINSLHKQMECSRNSIRKALDDLDKENHYLYHQIIERGNDDPKEDCINTRPAALYWEVVDLVKGLVEAKKTGPRKKGDELAELTIQMLAKNLTQEDPLSVKESFVRVCFLDNMLIRDRMVQQYQGEVKRRLECIEKLMENRPIHDTTEQILTVCKGLDFLISYLLEKYDVAGEPKKASTADINDLYEKLMTVRKKSRQLNDKQIPHKIRFSLTHSEEHDKIIHSLEDALSKCTRHPTGEARKEIGSLYNKYLLARLNKTKKKDVEQFDESFQTLKSLAQRAEADDETYEQEIREELGAFVRDMFEDLKKADVMPYSYDSFHSINLETAYMSAVMQIVHQHIMLAVHEPLRLIRISYSLIYFTSFPKEEPRFYGHRYVSLNSARVENHITSLKKVIWDLCNDHRELPLVLSPNDAWIEEFVECYEKCVAPVMHEKGISKNVIRTALEQLSAPTMDKEDQLTRMSALTQYLLFICHIVVCNKVEISVQEMKANHAKLLNFL